MAAIIRIKRSTGTSAPGSLKTGELAYSAGIGTSANFGDRLFFGKGDDGSGNATSIVVIGGEYLGNLLDHTPGTLTASSAIITDASNKIDNLKVDNIDINGNTISSTDTNGNIVLDPNGSGTVDVNTSKVVNVTDPTADQDAATKKYVDDQFSGGASTHFIAADAGSTYTVMSNDVLRFLGGTGISTTNADSSQTIVFNIDSSGVTAGDYGSSTAVPVLSVNAQGQITSASTASISTTLNTTGDTGTGSVSLGSQSITLTGGDNISTTASGQSVTIDLDGDVSGLTSLAVDNVSINGNEISSTTGTLDLNPSTNLRVNATGFTNTRIPYVSDNNGTLSTSSNFIWNNSLAT